MHFGLELQISAPGHCLDTSHYKWRQNKNTFLKTLANQSATAMDHQQRTWIRLILPYGNSVTQADKLHLAGGWLVLIYGHWVFISPPSAAHKLMTTNSGSLAWKWHSYDEWEVCYFLLSHWIHKTSITISQPTKQLPSQMLGLNRETWITFLKKTRQCSSQYWKIHALFSNTDSNYSEKSILFEN
jgi:hypothetical protein